MIFPAMPRCLETPKRWNFAHQNPRRNGWSPQRRHNSQLLRIQSWLAVWKYRGKKTSPTIYIYLYIICIYIYIYIVFSPIKIAFSLGWDTSLSKMVIFSLSGSTQTPSDPCFGRSAASKALRSVSDLDKGLLKDLYGYYMVNDGW